MCSRLYLGQQPLFMAYWHWRDIVYSPSSCSCFHHQNSFNHDLCRNILVPIQQWGQQDKAGTTPKPLPANNLPMHRFVHNPRELYGVTIINYYLRYACIKYTQKIRCDPKHPLASSIPVGVSHTSTQLSSWLPNIPVQESDRSLYSKNLFSNY